MSGYGMKISLEATSNAREVATCPLTECKTRRQSMRIYFNTVFWFFCFVAVHRCFVLICAYHIICTPYLIWHLRALLKKPFLIRCVCIYIIVLDNNLFKTPTRIIICHPFTKSIACSFISRTERIRSVVGDNNNIAVEFCSPVLVTVGMVELEIASVSYTKGKSQRITHPVLCVVFSIVGVLVNEILIIAQTTLYTQHIIIVITPYRITLTRTFHVNWFIIVFPLYLLAFRVLA